MKLNPSCFTEGIFSSCLFVFCNYCTHLVSLKAFSSVVFLVISIPVQN
uniref:Uncharacterized protein n=1 Tax=Rhizophora mucronata TaxID=61149 RepID=A0A2P2PV66_RHIMU